MQKQKIFIISTEYPPAPGGIGSHAYNITKELQKIGWEPVVATHQQYVTDKEIADFNASQGFEIIYLPVSLSMGLLFKNVLTILKNILKHKPAIVLGTGRYACYFAYFCARLTFRKCVMIGHGSEFIQPITKRSKLVHNRVFSKADSVIYVSQYTMDIAAEKGIDIRNGVVLYNGADDDFFKKLPAEEIEKFKAEKNITGQKILVTVGTLSDRKGQKTVVRAMPAILKQHPNTHYYCAGVAFEEPLKKLTDLVDEFGVNDNVHFLGKTPGNELLKWLNAADVFILPSTVVKDFDIEGFGIAVIEAAFCEKPSVVTNLSGAMESVEDGVSGLVAEMGDEASMAEKVNTLLSNDTMRAEMGKNALQRAQKSFTWKISALSYHKLFLQILKK